MAQLLDLAPRARKPPRGSVLAPGAPVARGLLGYWAFLEGGGWLVPSLRNTLTGTLTNPTNSTSGWHPTAEGPSWFIGPFVSGDTSYLTVPAIPIPGVCSYEAIWVHPSPSASVGILETTNGTFSNSTVDRTLYTDGSSLLTAYIYDGAAKTAVGPALTAGRRYHACFTVDGANLTLYLDGVQVAQTGAGNAYTGYTTPSFYYGVGANSGGILLGAGGGNLLAAGVWNRALTAREVQHRYLAPWAVLDAPAPPLPRMGFAVAGGPAVGARTAVLAAGGTVTTTQLAVRARTVAAPIGGLFTGTDLAVRARTAALGAGGLVTTGQLARRARTVAATAGGLVTTAQFAIRARTVAATAGGLVTTAQFAIRARTVAAAAGGLCTAVGAGIAAGVQTGHAALVAGGTLTAARLAVRARTATATAGGLLTTTGQSPSNIPQAAAALLVTATLAVVGIGRATLRGLQGRRGGQSDSTAQRGGTTPGGKRWTR